jgi:hypothetical protein
LEKGLDPMQLEGKPGYNADWFAQNKLARDGQMPARPTDPKAGESVDSKTLQSRVTLGKKAAGKEEADQLQDLQLNDYADKSQANAPAAETPPGADPFGGQAQNEQQNFRRYQERLSQQQGQLGQLNETLDSSGQQQAAGVGGPMSYGAFDQRARSGPQPGGGMPGMAGVPPTDGTAMDELRGNIRTANGDIGGGGRGDGFNLGGEVTAAPSIAGLASLDVEIPLDGVEYLFTTPRGRVQITARTVSVSLVSRLWGLGGVLGALLVVWIVTRPRLVQAYAFIAGTRAFAAGLIIIGLASIVLGILPLAGLVAVIVGSVLIARRLAGRLRPAIAA